MTLDEVKEKFKAVYLRTWFELADERPDELLFRTHRGSLIKVSADELRGYMDFEVRRGSFERKATESCLCSATHYEQPITSANRFSPILSARHGQRIIFGDPASDPLYVEISEASSDYKNNIRFHEYSVMRTLERIRLNRNSEQRELIDLIYAPTTIKVIGLHEASAEAATKKAIDIIEGCIFNLSYLKGITLVLEDDLPTREAIGDGFRYDEGDMGNELPLPKSRINRDIARFYHRGMAMDDPVNQFLSFYQVLEYFFLAVSDEELYRKLSSVLHDPLFSAKPRHLDKLIQATLNHKRESDETEMLRLVLAKHVDETELISFIDAYESHLSEKWFTKKRKLFGEENEVRATTGHVIGNIAKRVKLIRNALVHSSDRYNRQENFVPTKAAEAEIRKEVPLVKYLAERVIIGSST